jgi:catechol 2,3-dioxygenase-like lactoylglutathione lyase family enzyme
LDPIRSRSRSVPHTIPGLTGVDHIGFTVPDLEQARAFLVDVLGCEYLYSLGPFVHDEPGDDWMSEHLNVGPRAVMQQLHFFRLGGQAIFEVFQYAAPDQVTRQPRNSDIGGHHVALYVDDMDSAVAYLHEHGLTVLGDPTVSKGPSEGQRWVYFLAPWGMQFELVSYPGRKAFDRAGGTAEAWAAHTASGDPAGTAS